MSVIPQILFQRRRIRLIGVDVFVSEEVFDLFPIEHEHIQKFAGNVLKSNGIICCDINIVFINDEKMTELNEKYKKREGTTDVLSFNLSEESSDIVEGEVYISLERAEQQASDSSVPYDEEIIRLVTHGLLHLAGITHNNDEEYRLMMQNTEKFVKKYFHDGDMN
ncbi:MAG TPA: rRNA maturation RNase YbeY [bacterium]|nr:rRNA maturation RNase YbeY [bacterium]